MAKLPTVTTVTSGYYSTTILNNNFQALRDAFELFLSRDGATPNTMTADLDMNSNRILNVERLDVAGLYINGTAATVGSLAATPPASSITITDAGGYYTGTDVEAALQEVSAGLGNLAPLDTVGTAQIDNSAVTTAKINDAAVTDAKLANPAGQVLLARKAATGATVTFTEFDNSVYATYMVVLEGVEITSGNASGWIGFEISADGGSTFESTAFIWGEDTSATSGTATAQLCVGVGDQADGAYGLFGQLYLYRMGDTTRTAYRAQTHHENTSGNFVMNNSYGQVANTNTHNAIRFSTSLVGDFNNGWFSLYGLRK